MSRPSKAALLLAGLLVASAAHSDGIEPGTLSRGGISSYSLSNSAAPVVTCNGTGLIFTSACNSQYIGIL